MRGLFGFKKQPRSARPPPAAPAADNPNLSGLAARLNHKEIELYPMAIKILWHFYNPADAGKDEGEAKELPGPIDETKEDSVRELEKVNLIEIVPTFSDFGITAKLTKVGIQLMSVQPEAGRLAAVEVTDPVTGAITVYKQVELGF
jgi:hypothetical protein